MISLSLDQIKTTDKLQPRVAINLLIVGDYAEKMKSGNLFPPVEVVFDGNNYWMWDGFHRYEAIKSIGQDTLNANVTDGTLQDAEWLALSANKDHGFHRTNADKRRVVELALNHPYHRDGKGSSHRKIAEWCGVSYQLVNNVVNDNRCQSRNFSQIKPPIAEKIKREVMYVIRDELLADDLKEVQAISRLNEDDQKEVVDLVILNVSHTVKQAKKELQRLKKLEKRQQQSTDIPEDNNIWHGDFRVVGQKIPDNSVDLIFTDPPYNENAIELYRDLGIFARRVLKPGGLCLTYSGQIFLPQVLNALSESLEYIWCFAVKHSSGYTRIFKINGRNMWKPVVMFAKPKYEQWWKTLDDMINGKMEKNSHEWQQGVSEAEYYLEMLCPTNGFIVDPLCGSGTTLVAAESLNLRYVGIEDDINDIRKTKQRLNDKRVE